LAILPLFAAFEAHVINVTATIENALRVSREEVRFGTVFPQERLDQLFDVSFSGSFLEEGRVDDVDYVIRQKPKCGLPVPESNPVAYSDFEPVIGENASGTFICPQNYVQLPLLCPYLSKHEVTTDGAGENDSVGINAFHGAPPPWTLATTLATQVAGHLSKIQQDFNDQWNIDLRVPCFRGKCAQDWPSFVWAQSGSTSTDPEAYKLDPNDEHKLFGCDLWLEVSGVSETPPLPPPPPPAPPPPPPPAPPPPPQ
jgi:hypothetical protein